MEDFTYKNFVVVPYNHWKYDTVWIVEITDPEVGFQLFTRVFALDPREASQRAIEIFADK